MKKILVVGSINMDLTVHTQRIPEVGETILGDSFCVSPGGKGANQAIAAARLGGNVKFLGAVGNDIYGNRLVENLKKNNVDFCGISMNDTSSGIAVITVCNGDNSIILDKGANGKFPESLITENELLFKWADYVVMQAEIPQNIIVLATDYAKRFLAKVIFNPAPYTDFPNEFYKDVDVIVLNETETELMTGIKPTNQEKATEAIELIREKGVSEVIITLGERGSIYTNADQIKFEPAIKVKAVDTTAAGDCFVGAFTKMLSTGENIDTAIKYATRASAIAVSRVGASDSLPTHKEIGGSDRHE